MKNTLKKFGFIFAIAALIFAGASNLYADEHMASPEGQSYRSGFDFYDQNFEELETGGPRV